MIPKAIYKLKSQNPQQIRHSTEHIQPTTFISRSSAQPHSHNALHHQNKLPKQKLTKGCQKYKQLKQAYSSANSKSAVNNNKMIGSKQYQNHHGVGEYEHEQEQYCSRKQIRTQYEDGRGSGSRNGYFGECTFQPRLSAKGRQQSRSFKKFIEDQENYQHNKDNKIRQFRTEMFRNQLEECSSRPSIDKLSKRICTLMNYDKQQVVDRLYKQKTMQQYKDDQQLFSPKILPRSKSLKRNQNITQLLHSDAVRRQQTRNFMQSQLQNQPPASPSILQNTYQLVCNKMYNEFCDLIPEDQQNVPLVMAWMVISEIFGVQMNPNRGGKQAKMCQSMSRYLCMDKQGEGKDQVVDRSRLWEFLRVIVRRDTSRSTYFGNQAAEMVQKFGFLYTCRIAKPKTQRQPEKHSFFPETLRSSEIKAQKYRDKVLQCAKQFIENENSKIQLKDEVRIEDIFTIDYQMRLASQEKKRLSKQKQMMKQCTFKPMLSDNYKKPVYMPPTVTSSSKISTSKSMLKSTSSNNLSMTQSFFSQSLKPIDPISTLKPQTPTTNFNKSLSINIKASKICTQKQNNFSSIKKDHQNNTSTCLSVSKEVKNMQKAVLRMKIARKDRQLSNQIKNRGYPKNVGNWVAYTQQEKSQICNQHSKLKGLYKYKKVSLR